MLIYIGTTISVFTVIISSYYLLAHTIDIKRILAFAAIGFFSGTILLLGDRITTIRLPVLGEVVAKAREEASEITNIRKDVQLQSESIKDVLNQAADLQQEIGTLTKELELQKINVRKKILEEKISSIDADIREKRRAIKDRFIRYGPPSTKDEIYDKRNADIEINRLRKQVAAYNETLEKLKQEERKFAAQ